MTHEDLPLIDLRPASQLGNVPSVHTQTSLLLFPSHSPLSSSASCIAWCDIYGYQIRGDTSVNRILVVQVCLTLSTNVKVRCSCISVILGLEVGRSEIGRSWGLTGQPGARCSSTYTKTGQPVQPNQQDPNPVRFPFSSSKIENNRRKTSSIDLWPPTHTQTLTSLHTYTITITVLLLQVFVWTKQFNM